MVNSNGEMHDVKRLFIGDGKRHSKSDRRESLADYHGVSSALVDYLSKDRAGYLA